jgi:hypothetical protein
MHACADLGALVLAVGIACTVLTCAVRLCVACAGLGAIVLVFELSVRVARPGCQIACMCCALLC